MHQQGRVKSHLLISSWQKLGTRAQDVPAKLRDPNNLIGLLPIVKKSLEHLIIG